MSRTDLSTGLLSLFSSEILIRADLLLSSGASGDILTVASFTGAEPFFTGRPGDGFRGGDCFRLGDVFLPGEAFRAGKIFFDGEAFLAGDALRAGEAFRAGEALRTGDVFLVLEGDALRPGETLLGGGEGDRFRAMDFLPRLAVSAGPGTAALDTGIAEVPPLVGRRLSI